MRIRTRYKPPGYRTAQLVLVPVIAALLALGGLFVSCNPGKESSWNSPKTSAGTTSPRDAAAKTPGAAVATGSISGSTPATAPARTAAAPSTDHPSDLREQRNFSPRSDVGSESIQLTPCQRSAAECFSFGGLDSLLDNLDGVGVHAGTGQLCFEFQDGCERR